ncbi:MAG TPA: hypothetical protein VNK82_08265 [Terriglobales bacterium]|nr:hypothetical protein [Terriglobales bacterium]
MPIFLIAGNLVREQRWPMLFLVLWSGVVALAFTWGEEELIQNDFVFLLGQEALYAVAFATFVAAFSVHNERRSRRILAVLSKAIERRQYLAGMLLGVLLCCAAYCVSIGLSALWITRKMDFPAWQFVLLTSVLVMTCAVAAAIALFFATFLDPLPATAATALLIAAPAALERLLGAGWANAIPVYSLSAAAMRFSYDPAWNPGWGGLGVAVVQTVVFWVAASWVFERRDIAVAVE